MVDILSKGQEELQKKGMKAFTKHWKVFVNGTGFLEEEVDEIPIITPDTVIQL
jgi:hypothetical protein